MENKWISVKDKLPLDHINKKDWSGVVDEVLVTVELKFPDPNDDREVTLLWFDNETNQFSQEIGGKPYEEDHSWHVVAWMPKPEAYKSKKKKERVVFVNARKFIE